MLYEHLREYPEYKTINYITAVPLQKKMREALALEALYTWKKQILECATSNFFVVEGGKLFTPKDNILFGITRRAVIDLARANGFVVQEGNVSLQEVYSADECFITSSFKDVVPVVQVGDRIISNGKVGPITKKMIELFEQNLKIKWFAFLAILSYYLSTMSQDRLIQLKNKATGEVYWTSKNKKKVERKIELKKYSKKLRKRVAFKEAKK